MLPRLLKLFRNGLAIFVLLAVPAISNTSGLKQETLNAWDDYLRTANLRMYRNLGTGDPFLWIEEEPGRSQRVRQGEILISPAREASPRKVHDGLIHDWIGAIFIPSVRMNDVFAIVHDYNRYKDFYKPTVIESKLVGRTGEEYQFSMVGLKSVLFEKIVLEGQFESHCSQLDGRRRYCISFSTRVQEIKDYGQPDSHKLPTDEGHGYIWRLYSLTKFEERDGGVYIEVEAIALSRDISASVRWLTKPVVERVSRNSLSTILQLTGEAMRSNIAACDGKDLKTRKVSTGKVVLRSALLRATCRQRPASQPATFTVRGEYFYAQQDYSGVQRRDHTNRTEFLHLGTSRAERAHGS